MTLVYDGTNYQKTLGDTSGRAITIEYGKKGHTATQVTGDGDIYNGACVLYGVILGALGVTTGDIVEIQDGSGGATKVTFVFGAANETIVAPFPVPIAFTTGAYSNATLTGGTAYVTGIYDAA